MNWISSNISWFWFWSVFSSTLSSAYVEHKYFAVWFAGLVAPMSQIWKSGMDQMKDCWLWHGSRNRCSPVKHPVSQTLSQWAFLRGCCRALYLLCHFLSLSISFIFFTLNPLNPYPLPCCLLWYWGCLLSGTSAVKSPFVLNSYLVPPPSIYRLAVEINNMPLEDLSHLIWHLIQSWVIYVEEIQMNSFSLFLAPPLCSSLL